MTLSVNYSSHNLRTCPSDIQIMNFPKNLVILGNGLLLLLLVLSGIINAVLFGKVRQYYEELNATRLDPSGLREYSIGSEGNSQDMSRIVVFGDSRAASWPEPLNTDQYEFVNRGIPSQTSVQTLQRLQTHIPPLQPDIVILQVGVNDLKTIALFPEDKATILANCKNNIRSIVTELNSLGSVVILTTIFPTGKVPLTRKPFWSEDIEKAIQEVNTYIQSLESDQVIVFDAFTLIVNSEGQLRSEYALDELHLNMQGYTVLNGVLIKSLANILQ